jgi:hypothetical protein
MLVEYRSPSLDFQGAPPVRRIPYHHRPSFCHSTIQVDDMNIRLSTNSQSSPPKEAQFKVPAIAYSGVTWEYEAKSLRL